MAVVTIPGAPPAGFTATSLTSVSLDPPVVSFCAALTNSCWPALRITTHVAVNLLREDQIEVARNFATPGIDRFALPRWRPGAFATPLLEGVLGWLECEVFEHVVAGSQAIVLVRPLRVHIGEGLPLLYHQGRYTALARSPEHAGG